MAKLFSPAMVFPSRWSLTLLGALLAASLTACGFRLLGTQPLPFDSLYIDIPDTTRFGADIRRSIRAVSPHTRLVEVVQDAQVRLQNLGLTRSQREMSLNPQGQVEEYELTLTLRFRVTDRNGELIIPDTTLSATRDMPYDAQVVQAKQSEMETLYQDMEHSLVSRILRRLTAPDVHEAMARVVAENAAENGTENATENITERAARP